VNRFNVTDMKLRMGYVSSDETGEVFDVVIDPVDMSAELDYVILRVEGSPGHSFGTIDLQVRDPRPDEELFLIHHPEGRPQTLTRKSCRLANISSGNADTLWHRCDTSKGSSGSLLFSDNDNSVIGLHFAGSANPGANLPNSAKRLASLVVRSTILQRIAQNIDMSDTAIRDEASDIVSRAEAGGHLQLQAGDYDLTRPVHVAKDLRISGVGAERTVLTIADGQALFTLAADVTLELVGVSLHFAGHQGGSAILAEQGTLIMRQTRIAGSRGHGVRLTGDARAQISNSEFFNNDGSALYVAGRAYMRLESSFIRGNDIGIRFADAATGELLNNVSDVNQRYGLSVQDDANVMANENFFRDNEASGVHVAGRSQGIFAGNTIDNNVYSGINVQDAAKPDLARNILRGNGHAGITYLGSAGGRAVRNISESNGFHGIAVRNEAAPTLEDNVLRNNNAEGLAYYELARGSATGNTIEGNDQGIVISDDSQPTLNGNILRNNDRTDSVFQPAVVVLHNP
jgi:parallel beta-helix repeat protein